MAYQFPPDLDKLVKGQMAAHGYTSEDDVLRDALNALGQISVAPDAASEEYQQSVLAVREGLADMEAGRMVPVRNLFADILNTTAL
jgi:predicted transcriptional regulator